VDLRWGEEWLRIIFLRIQVHPPPQVVEARVTHISKAGADIGTDRSFVWAFDILILAL